MECCFKNLVDDITESGFDSVGKDSEIAYLFKMRVRNMSYDSFYEFFHRQRDKDLFLELFIVKPERDRLSVKRRDSGLGENRAFGISADILNGERKGVELSADMNVEDIAVVEHVQK